MKTVMVLSVFVTAAWAQGPADLTVVSEGSLPVILTAPHGGRMPIPEASIRRGIGVIQFVTVRDDNTLALAELIAAGLEKKLGGKPFCVFARFERKYADANRKASEAYESDAAKPIYEHYHASIAKAREAIDKDWGVGLLLDIHGQGQEVNAIVRGTDNGKTCKHLLDRHGPEALLGPKSLFGRLAEQGFTVEPAVGSKDRENPRYNGGYTVQAYGSRDGGRIDAIQLEFGTNLRQKARLAKTADGVVTAIAAFVEDYVPVRKK